LCCKKESKKRKKIQPLLLLFSEAGCEIAAVFKLHFFTGTCATASFSSSSCHHVFGTEAEGEAEFISVS
jgi:hypothetical protein